ncbi:MAG: tetratricopeptide repeat protein [Polyangiaceae bacterium]|nr:tetratricopeptide repeat protein [Polyangiaceae bacterium]
MAEQEDEKQLSRRARRRAQAVSEEAEASTASEPGDEAEERDDQGEGDAEGDAEADAESDAEGGPSAEASASDDDDAPKKLSKSEKKRAKQEEKSATATVRDRNKRLREQGVAKRRTKRDKERHAAVAQGLDASEMMDDAFARGTHATAQFIRKNASLLQWLIVLAIVGGIGLQVYSWRSKKAAGKTSDGLMTGVDSELGRVGTESANPDEAAVNSRPTFATDEARLEAAAKAFAEAESAKPGSGTSILSMLGRAGVLYDQGKFDDAKALYEKVQGSELAKHDADVRLRSLEGVGLCLEAKSDADGALKVFQDLEKSDEQGFAPLGLYHQARVLFAKGDKDKAKELLTKVKEKLDKEKSPFMTDSYVEKAARELLAIIDPSTAPTGGSSYSPEQLDKMREQILKDPAKLKKMLEDMGKLKVPSMPPVPGGPGGPTDPGEAPGPAPEPAPEPEPAPTGTGAP